MGGISDAGEPAPGQDPVDPEELELELLLCAIHRRWGYDFRSYARATLKRRIARRMAAGRFRHLSELIGPIVHDRAFFEAFLGEVSVNVTEMFRDPAFFLALRRSVVPRLKTWPFVNVWHAGCSTGEEVYSSAIILHEERFLARAHLYATDISAAVLETARQAIYPAEKMREYTESYQRAGGTRSFSDYYQANYDSAKLCRVLTDPVTFAQHNLVTDGVFAETHLVICRNVLIYFNRELQDRVLQCLVDSLCHGGVLCLGARESVRFSSAAARLEPIDALQRIYRKVG